MYLIDIHETPFPLLLFDPPLTNDLATRFLREHPFNEEQHPFAISSLTKTNTLVLAHPVTMSLKIVCNPTKACINVGALSFVTSFVTLLLICALLAFAEASTETPSYPGMTCTGSGKGSCVADTGNCVYVCHPTEGFFGYGAINAQCHAKKEKRYYLNETFDEPETFSSPEATLATDSDPTPVIDTRAAQTSGDFEQFPDEVRMNAGHCIESCDRYTVKYTTCSFSAAPGNQPHNHCFKVSMVLVGSLVFLGVPSFGSGFGR